MQIPAPGNTISSVLLVMLFCYLPHLFTSPWWLSILLVAVISYRLFAVYYLFPLPGRWSRAGLIVASILLLLWYYRSSISSGFYIGFLLTFTALKSLEAQTSRDLRVLVLCNFYIILSALLLQQELWVFPYVIFSVLANLGLMLKLAAPKVAFKPTGRRLLKHFLIALPISLFLFYLFPRFIHPLWRVPTLSQTKLGFSEEMTIGNLSEVFDDDSTVMRVIFKQPFKPSLYWRGLVLSSFNGWSWKSVSSNVQQFVAVKALANNDLANYEILLEPHQKKWLFYQDNPVEASPNLLFSSAQGLMQLDKSPVYQRLDYSIIDKPPTYQVLTNKSIQQNTHLPPYGNPRIRAWAKQQFAAANNDPQGLIKTISQRINLQPYWYSLNPGHVEIQANLMDKFWFETKRGYCEYYTGAVAIILRAVGIPARVVVGYHGGQWNPLAQYLTVQQNDAHAWLEYWQEGRGWQRLDPVTFIAPERIDPSIHQKHADDFEQAWNIKSTSLPWLMQAAYVLESAQFFSERWLLFYNQDTQRLLLQKIGLEQWDEVKLLQAFIAAILLLLMTGGIWYLIQQQWEQDALLVEYHRLQWQIKSLGVPTQPPATFAKQLHDLSLKRPHLKPLLTKYAEEYERLRLHQVEDKLENRKLILKSFKTLRVKLQK